MATCWVFISKINEIWTIRSVKVIKFERSIWVFVQKHSKILKYINSHGALEGWWVHFSQP